MNIKPSENRSTFEKVGGAIGAGVGATFSVLDMIKNKSIIRDTFTNSKINNLPKPIKAGIIGLAIATSFEITISAFSVLGEISAKGFEILVNAIKGKNKE